jgi:putative ABC transport system substrate-binding protein
VRIGALVPPVLISPEEGLRQGLRELGYIEGRNLTIERRIAGTNDALQSGVADLARSRVDLIVAFGTPAARAALSATSTIPVVFLSGDPVGTGLAASLARPGANVTGVSSLSTELMSKRLELLQQIAPRIRRVILLGNPSNPLNPGVLEEAQKAARTLRIHMIALDARNADELDAALRGIQRGAADAFVVSSDYLFLANRAKIAEAVIKAKLPAIFPWRDYHDAGVLMSYGANLKEIGRRAAIYVDKILKGAKPEELPIEQMSQYELVIDLRVARAMGLKVPRELLLRADEVIR